MLVTPPIDPSEVTFIGPLALRILGLTLLLINSFLFSKLFQKKLIPCLILLINPWSVYLHTFFTFQSLFITAAIILIKKGNKLLLLLLALLTFVYLQKTLPKDYLFLPKLKPANLAFEINERQKIDFLATGKTFILPPVIRKITYNKPMLALDKILRHFVSFIDFEQMTAPLESYEIVKLSGLSPKGNFPMFFIWEVPLIIYGIFINKKLLPFIVILLIPIFAAEKKLFTQTALLTLPVFLYWEIQVLEKIKPKHLLMVTAILFIVFVIHYYITFYTKPLMYKSPENYYYQEIAKWVNKNEDKKIIVTTMFGPTEKMTKYYLSEIPSNVSFQPFDLNKELPQKNTYYIGLPGQFLRHGKNLTADRSLVPVIEIIKGEDELVFEYGENLWIGYQK